VSGLGGYWLAGRNDEARDERAARREERARLVTREDRLEDEREAFQRDVRLELQDRLLALTRTTREVILQDRRTLKQQGQLYQLSEDLNQRSHEAGVALLRIRERVLNEDLRRKLKALQEFDAEVDLLSIRLRETDAAQAIAQLDAASAELVRRHILVNEILGRELRAVLGRSASASAKRDSVSSLIYKDQAAKAPLLGQRASASRARSRDGLS
jgi:hypothetical protein